MFFLQDKDEPTKEPTTEEENTEIKENGVSDSEEGKTPSSGDAPVVIEEQLNDESTTPVIEKVAENENEKIEETTNDNNSSKKIKEKSKKKKWSFRSLSFSKKDKSKPNKETDKNGDVMEITEEVSVLLL